MGGEEKRKMIEMHTLLAKVGRRQHARHGMALGHLLKDLNEEADLHLSSLLQQSIKSSGALRLAEHTKPLLDSTELVLEVLIKGCSSHLFKCRLVLVNVCNPLLSSLLCRIIGVVKSLTLLGIAEVDL